MSAIWGLWNYANSPDTAPELARMTAVLRQFGPTACHHAPHIGLGRAIANTLPEDINDSQPIQLPNGDILIASVRLDGRESLAAHLDCPLHLPDSELLAAAWLLWGDETPRHLTGEFAFAVWQPRLNQLFLAIDHLGCRSLYYGSTPTQFIFATLPRAIHAVRSIPRTLNSDALAAQLAYFPPTLQGTIFNGILRMPSGHSLTVSPEKVLLTRYWTPENTPTLRLSGDDAYAQAFRDTLDTAVRDRLRSTSPVACMLSGGFDSGAVTASAAHLLSARGITLPAFTGVPDPAFNGHVPTDRFADESSHAAAVAALYPNIRHSLVTPLSAFPLDHALANFPRIDAPGGALTLLPGGAAIAEAHRAAGIRVVLNGTMGNLTISYNGLPLIPKLAGSGHLIRWFQESRGLVRHAHFRWPGIFALSFGPQAPQFLWKYVQRRRTGFGSGLSRHTILHPRYMNTGRIQQLGRERGIDSSSRPFADGRRFRIQYLTQRNHTILNAAAEYRDPTADKRLIEFCLGVPEDQYLRNGATKFLLRRAMRDRLPPVVLNEWRKGLCAADWHLRVAPYRERFRNTLEDIALSPFASDLLDLPRLRSMLDNWPTNWDAPSVRTEYGMGFCQAIHAGAFIRWVEKELP